MKAPNSARVSLEELKDRFLSQVSHEFRSPLATLIGYLDLLGRQSDQLSLKHREYVQAMQSSSHRLKVFVDNVIDMSRLEAGLVECAFEPVDVREILAQVIEGLRSQWEPLRQSLHLQCSPGLAVFADPQHLKKIIAQVLSNAIHFTPDEGSISVWAKAGGQRSILMGVTDSGGGIPRKYFDRVFQPFGQASGESAPRKIHGTGLGLAIAKGLVRLQKGQIWIEQSSKRGTTVAWAMPKPRRAAHPLRQTPIERLAA